MKTLIAIPRTVFESRTSPANLQQLGNLLLVMAGLIGFFTVVFPANQRRRKPDL